MHLLPIVGPVLDNIRHQSISHNFLLNFKNINLVSDNPLFF